MTITPECGTAATHIFSAQVAHSFRWGRRSMTRKKQRGPRPASERAPIGAPIPSKLLARVDRWAASQEDDPSRPEAIRRLVELGLAISQRGRARTRRATKAAEMASQEIDRLSVPS